MKYLLFSILNFICTYTFTQNDSLLLFDIAKLKNIIRDTSSAINRKEIEDIEGKVLQMLRQRESVAATEKNLEIAYSCALSMKHVKNQQLRNEMVERITKTCIIDSSSKCYRSFNLLTHMRLNDFSDEAKRNIYKKALASKFSNVATLLVGFLNIREAYAELKKIANPGSVFSINVTLALARMGDESTIQDFAEQITFSDHPNYITLSQVSYIKQPQIISAYNDYLHSNRPAQHSYDVRGIDDASLGAKYLARILIDFPLKFQNSPYTPEQIALARQWMLANKGKYKVNRDEY